MRHVARVGRRGVYKGFSWETCGHETHLENIGICMGNNIKINLQEIVRECVNWIGLAAGRERCRDLLLRR